MAEYAWLHLTTGPPAVHLRLLELARRHGLRVAVDPAQEIHYRWSASAFRTLVAGAEILFGNRSEIARALELLGLREPEELTAIVPLVVRTDGPRGAVAFARGSTVRVRARRAARVRSLVGAGDAFRGGFYAGWFEGAPLAGCLEAGTRAAARWIGGTPSRGGPMEMHAFGPLLP
ncbi:Carbohydrate/purine kinase domain protein, partial [mine drainage metagenome]